MSNISSFTNLVYSIRDKAVLEDFLLGVTTAKERQELTQRIEIVKRLLAKEPHQKIARDLKVGVTTVTRGSKELAAGRFKALHSKKMGLALSFSLLA